MLNFQNLVIPGHTQNQQDYQYNDRLNIIDLKFKKYLQSTKNSPSEFFIDSIYPFYYFKSFGDDKHKYNIITAINKFNNKYL